MIKTFAVSFVHNKSAEDHEVVFFCKNDSHESIMYNYYYKYINLHKLKKKKRKNLKLLTCTSTHLILLQFLFVEK